MAEKLKPGMPGYRNPRFTKILDENGEIRDGEEIPMVRKLAICRTPGCPAEGVVFPTKVGENMDGIYYVICVQCKTGMPELREPGDLPITQDLSDFRQRVHDARLNNSGLNKDRKKATDHNTPPDPVNREERKRAR